MDYFEAARELAKGLMSGERQSAAHRLDHIEHVLLNVSEIAAHYPPTDMKVLRLAALLHDVDQPYDRKEENVELSTRDAAKLLHEVGCPSQKADRVLKMISEHSTEGIKRPASLEAGTLFDADKLDGLGASGIARVFALFGQRGQSPLDAVPWYLHKVELAIKDMQTAEGRDLALERVKYAFDFLDRIEEENRLAGSKPQFRPYLKGMSKADE